MNRTSHGTSQAPRRDSRRARSRLPLLAIAATLALLASAPTAASAGVPADARTPGEANAGADPAATDEVLRPTTVRLAGADRYETAVTISRAGHPDGAGVVYVASGVGFADALSAGPAAAHAGGPLLLTRPSALPPVVRAEIERLAPEQIIVVGGEGAVSADVYATLAGLAPGIRRDAGPNRYATSRVLNERAFGGDGPFTVSLVATGRDYPDALSAGATAGAWGVPVLLVDGLAPRIDAETKDLLERLGVGGVHIVGGTGAVTTGIEQDLGQVLEDGVVRHAGKDRYETSVYVNSAVFASADEALLATGGDFADALAGAALAGSRPVPLWVVPKTCVPRLTLDEGRYLGVTRYTLLGGRGALGDGVESLDQC
ncbi:cell wall-binding repeat-containing protein [Cellulosimicrobium cellulans]|uniref:cell wall-binding repeat-containing protein n=1 Tax=Cellulosimicrobium cellulans TaxID=1710 RepID=UPI001EDA7BC0|nr:cell wall-binding repeat-containing protein [Cellulosimicrobium cellulans]UKJ65515.1 cell wall-binding repeat-containing protein [Cellulosimicrobium cellulans]